MKDTIGFSNGDGDGILRMFERWTDWESREDEVKTEVGDKTHTIIQQANFSIEKGKIHVQGTTNSVNERCGVFANIGGEVVRMGFTDAQAYDNGKNYGTFVGAKGTKFQGVKKNFNASNRDDLDVNFRSWFIEELSKRYPEDYEKPQNEDKIEAYKGVSKGGISFTLDLNHKDDVTRLTCEISGQEYSFSPEILEKGPKYTSCIKTNHTGIVKHQLPKISLGSNRELLSAIGDMLDNIQEILFGTSKKIKKNWNYQSFLDAINENKSV